MQRIQSPGQPSSDPDRKGFSPEAAPERLDSATLSGTQPRPERTGHQGKSSPMQRRVFSSMRSSSGGPDPSLDAPERQTAEGPSPPAKGLEKRLPEQTDTPERPKTLRPPHRRAHSGHV